MWTLVGLGLLVAGTIWTVRGRASLAPEVLAAAAVAGLAKARFVLFRTADRATRRIERRGDGRFIGGFLSWPSWLLVLGMIALGRLLRMSPLPLVWRGAVYFAIGTALFASGLRIWAFRRRSTTAR